MNTPEYCSNCNEVVSMHIADGGVRCSKCSSFYSNGGVTLGYLFKDKFEEIKNSLKK